MLILALESSAGPASAAVYQCDDNGRHGKLLGQYFQNNGFSHSCTLMAMADSLLRNLGIKPADLGLIAAANGPGSFTGVRIGVSAAKGLAFGLDIPVCGVSALEAMARQTEGVTAKADIPVLICPVMDARRGQVYNALFKWQDNSLIRLREDRAVSIADLAADLRGFAPPGEDAVSFMPAGDGTDLVITELTGKEGLKAIPPCPLIKYQTAYGVALAAPHTQQVSASALEPVYLRPSQAERELNRKRAQG